MVMVELLLIAALCGVFFMLGRCWEEFCSLFYEPPIVWTHPVTGARFTSYGD